MADGGTSVSDVFLEACNLGFQYPDGTAALHEVSFTVSSEESVGIIGANGAGKSTLLLHLVGCLLPNSGSLTVFGQPVERKTVAGLQKRVGLVFQDPDDQLFMPTVREDVEFGPRNQGCDEHQLQARVAQAVRTVGGEALLDRAPYHLSGGEKRAVSIATVLAMAPEALVLDEPSAGLDPQSRRSVIELLQRLTCARVVASHDLDLILAVCQRVILMHRGRIAADGPCSEILQQRELLERCGLELPLRFQACPVCRARRGATQG